MNRILRRNETLVALLIVVLSLVIGLINPTFFTVANVFDLLRSIIVTGIFAMGVLIVIVSGGIDVSFTAIGVFALYATVRLMKAYAPDAPIWLAFVSASYDRPGSGVDQRFLHRPVQAADPDRHAGHPEHVSRGFYSSPSATRSFATCRRPSPDLLARRW